MARRKANQLHISDDLALPLEAVTQTFAILAKRGMGKTYTAAVLVEELVDAGQRVLVIDPIGVWWGLRAGADGDPGGGLPVVVLGGEHGDLPIQPDAGDLIGDLVIDHPAAYVVDVSLMRKGQQRTLVTGLLETVYRRNRDALHVVLDEADAWAPQRSPRGDEAVLSGAVQDLVRRGRARGIGVTLITQRPAVLSKDVLTQAEVLVALRMVGPQDREALKAWVSQHGDPEQQDKLFASLASLPVGTAWVWSPGWLDLFRRVDIRPRRTYDSSATPKPGETRADARLAPVDLGELRDRMASLVEEVEATDPKKLQARIRDLEKQLAAGGRDDAALRKARGRVTELEAALEVEQAATETATMAGFHFRDQVDVLQETLTDIRSRIDQLLEDLHSGTARRTAAIADQQQRATPARNSEPSTRKAPSATRNEVASDVALKAGARRMLAYAAAAPGGTLTRAQVGLLARIAHTGGTFARYLSDLRAGGYVDTDGDQLIVTDAGAAAAEPVDWPRDLEDAAAWWGRRFKAGARRMLEEVITAGTLTRDQLGDAAGIEPSGGTFARYLSDLRSAGVIAVDGARVTIGPALAPFA